jgi:hypothetical protein
MMTFLLWWRSRGIDSRNPNDTTEDIDYWLAEYISWNWKKWKRKLKWLKEMENL